MAAARQQRKGTVDWPAVARRLGRAWNRRRIVAEAWQALREDPASRPWLLACSGGADSVALVLWVWQAFPDRRAQMRVVHVHHGLRGAAADADAAFVAEMAGALGLQYELGRLAGKAAPRSEDGLRRARLDVLRRLAGGTGARVLTGHQADDLLEHFLLRLARGSGAEGLSGLRPAGVGPGYEVARPLLRLGRERLRADLAAAGGMWCEDASNAQPLYARNRLRAEALPAWRAAVPQDLDAAADRARRRLAEESEALDFWLEQLLGPLEAGATSWDARPLLGLPVALFRRRLSAWLAGLGLAATLKAGATDHLVEAWAAGKPAVVAIGPGRHAHLRAGRLSVRVATTDPA